MSEEPCGTPGAKSCTSYRDALNSPSVIQQNKMIKALASSLSPVTGSNGYATGGAAVYEPASISRRFQSAGSFTITHNLIIPQISAMTI